MVPMLFLLVVIAVVVVVALLPWYSSQDWIKLLHKKRS